MQIEMPTEKKDPRPHMSETFLTDRQVGERYGVHYLTPRRWVKVDPTFPRPVKLSPGCTRWKLSALQKWERDAAQ